MPLDGETLGNVFIKICKAWLIVAIGALVMPFIVYILILIENLNCYREVMGTSARFHRLYLGNDQRVYDSFSPPAASGYVNETNIPKHLGGAVFVAVFCMAMMMFIIVALCADLSWKYPRCKNILVVIWAPGLYEGGSKRKKMFVIASAFLKLFIVAATGALSFTGLKPDDDSVDTPLFCLYAVMILLCSILPTALALAYVLDDKEESAASDPAKAAEEGKAKT